MVKSQACSEFRVINQENLPSREKEIENPQIIHTLPPTGFKFEEVNDIRQIEEELNRAKVIMKIYISILQLLKYFIVCTRRTKSCKT